MKNLEIKKIMVTPAYAQELLKNNTSNNRNINKHVVLRYANDMKNGRWKDNTGETIKISKSFKILDGQHRLKSVVKANTTVQLDFIFDLDESVFDVIDTGKSRNASDCFKIADVPRSNSIPSTIVQYNTLKSGLSFGRQKDQKPSNSELLEQYYLDEKRWQEVVRISLNWYHSFAKILSPSFIGGFYAYFCDISYERAFEFMDQVATGTEITNNSISLLRNKLIQDKMSIKKMTITTKMALVIKTWNFFISNKDVKKLVFDDKKERFPIAKKTYDSFNF